MVVVDNAHNQTCMFPAFLINLQLYVSTEHKSCDLTGHVKLGSVFLGGVLAHRNCWELAFNLPNPSALNALIAWITAVILEVPDDPGKAQSPAAQWPCLYMLSYRYM